MVSTIRLDNDAVADARSAVEEAKDIRIGADSNDAARTAGQRRCHRRVIVQRGPASPARHLQSVLHGKHPGHFTRPNFRNLAIRGVVDDA